MSEPGTVFPPRDEWDVAAYDIAEVVEGYRSSVDDPDPGPNRSPAFRWGWCNRQKDCRGAPDGYEDIRHRYYLLTRRPQ